MKRQPKGRPTGGQFAAGDTLREEAGQLDTQDWGETPNPRTSPWGKVQQSEELAPGIMRVYTASHGGVKLSPERNRAIPSYMRKSNAWYEEDCEHYIPSAVFDGDEASLDGLRRWYPDEYEKFTGVAVKPGESPERDRRVFQAENADNWVVVSASKEGGQVKAIAVKGGIWTKDATRRTYMLDDYTPGRFGYVVPDSETPVSEETPEPWKKPKGYGFSSPPSAKDMDKLYRSDEGVVESVGDIVKAGRMTGKTVVKGKRRRSFALVEHRDGYHYNYPVTKDTYDKFEAPES